ncbi:MAG: hypothetical protein KDA80_12690 [Planctomycetaceae bacterium]|nr:hypothetical protein [Planctomycetaceae bacterium]
MSHDVSGLIEVRRDGHSPNVTSNLWFMTSFFLSLLAGPFAHGQFVFAIPRMREVVREIDVILVGRLMPIKAMGEDQFRYSIFVERIIVGSPPVCELTVDTDWKDPDETYAMAGRWNGETLEWSIENQRDDELLQYLTRLPPLDAPVDSTIPFFLETLSTPHALVRGDAMRELREVPFETLTAITTQLPESELRQWLSAYLATPKEQRLEHQRSQLAIRCLLLAACDQSQDAPLFLGLLDDEFDDTNDRAEVLFAALLTGGNAVFQQVLESEYAANDVVGTDWFQLAIAIEMVLDTDPDRLERADLGRVARRLLEDPELQTTGLQLLTRLKDWTPMGRIFMMYNDHQNGRPPSKAMRRAIIHYLQAAAADKSPSAKNDSADHVAQARKYLKFLKETGLTSDKPPP